MVVKKYIEENLKHLDQAYRKEADGKKATYYSKLAILELCGWIELSMDSLVLDHCARKVKLPSNVKLVETNVNKTYGFDYEQHFRKMLIHLIGIPACEQIERTIDVAAKTKLEAQLSSLKKVRNGLAHTYIKGTPKANSIDAPSVTRARLVDIYDGLKAFQKALNSL
ncbi:hypothetical protein ASE36_15490 [Rhizobium sp. Root274]|uniref:HEPN domain-containing protein n=1 Tax=unclassified Rhizobium TaxID=2613769 RepID=UPI000714E2CE|nr:MULTISPECIES: HEPN domain-containing protein [unclassified Rhizobium]KQW27879.1 hypothetical protein ASC71_15520 [Rhizobium sp. Root1240]KRD28160.1 hypothetical protein ASE36_15490 [Rhizobium sp. Root274]